MTTATYRSRARSLAVTATLVTAAIALLAATVPASASAPANRAPEATAQALPAAPGLASGPAASRRALAQARAATARYHDVEVAYADGYEPAGPCVAAPGLGAMGVHLVNHDRLVDGVLDPAAPEALLYLPKDGGLELIGVEYVQVDADQDLGTDDDRPTLFGVPFDGPMEGHGPGEPVHYDLHVWVWKHNPAGMTAPFNPALACPAGTGGAGH